VPNLHLSLSCYEYDVTRLLIDGTVRTQGVDLTAVPLVSGERHNRVAHNVEFDVTEIQMAMYVAWKALDAPVTAIPVFLFRKFNHGNITVAANGPIKRPQDLQGRTIGVLQHCDSITLWNLGVLMDEYGVDPRSLHIRTLAEEHVPDWEPCGGMDVQLLEKGGQSPGALLNAGVVDAFIHRYPGPYYRQYRGRSTRAPSVRCLFPNYREIEVDYYKRTGIFPMRHVIVVRNEVLERDPWVAANLVKSFTRAMDLGIDLATDQRTSFLPWYSEELREEQEIMQPTAWDYNIEENRVALETFSRYAAACGATSRQLSIEELFAESVLQKFPMQFDYPHSH